MAISFENLSDRIMIQDKNNMQKNKKTKKLKTYYYRLLSILLLFIAIPLEHVNKYSGQKEQIYT